MYDWLKNGFKYLPLDVKVYFFWKFSFQQILLVHWNLVRIGNGHIINCMKTSIYNESK